VLELSGIRLGADSYILDRQDGVTVDGRAVSAPYRLVALGDPPTMEQALRIPGGVVDTVAAAGGQATIAGSSSLQVRSLRALPRDEYASPAPR
jgi:uncharacterized protein YlxW (UPF0749 family)